jgi:Zn-dependent protease with chaperone function
MDFFASQDVARKKTGLLLVYFGLAVFCIIVAIYLAITFLFVYQKTQAGQFEAAGIWNPELFGLVAGVTLLVVITGSLYKIATLRSGGARVAEMLGGKLIPGSSEDFLEQRLLNIIEEMAIASGVPVPPVYVMAEESINAFAAGFTPDDAVIGITRGALQTLNRDELQGVIAHEFSHILNGDMWLDLKLVGFLHGILLITLIGRSILRGSSRSRSSKNSGGAAFFGLALLVFGFVGVLFGKLIKSAVSRQREYLADASAVQFTRNPYGLAGALKKIGGLAAGSVIDHNRAEEISHMFFSNGLRAGWIGAFSTHPPLTERIKRLDPAFEGIYPEVARDQATAVEKETADKDGNGAEGRLSHEKMTVGNTMIALAILAADPKNITRDIGAPLREHLLAARRLLDSLPEEVREAASNPFGARAVIYGLLLDKDAAVRKQQLDHLRGAADQAVFEATGKILPQMLVLDETARLPLMDLAMPSLRSLSLQQFRSFEANINRLVTLDRRVSLFEFVLQHIIVRRLEKSFAKPQQSAIEISSIRDAARDVSCILSLFAHIGHENDEAEKAFSGAAATFAQHAGLLHFMSRKECRSIHLGEVLDRLSHLGSKVKKSLITAAFQCLVHDKQITMKEAEFFRLLVYALDCPLPPWVKI